MKNHRRASLFRAAADVVEKGTITDFVLASSLSNPDDLTDLIDFMKGMKKAAGETDAQAISRSAKLLREMAWGYA